MCASKTIYAAQDPSSLHLPVVSKKPRRRLRHSPTSSSIISVPNANVPTNAAENVSALKAKYTDYATWLKASSRQNREPVFTHELLKHSLCQMGIDSTQATQLVSTCTWYVYQFQKGLGPENEPPHDRPTTTTTEIKKPPLSAKIQRNNIIKSKKIIPSRDHSSESETTFHSISKENILTQASRPATTRNKYSVLPSIHPSDTALSPRSRRVDFDYEQTNTHSTGKQKTLPRRSAIAKTRNLPKLRPTETESTVIINDQNDIVLESTPLDTDLSNSHKNLRRNSIMTGQTRSILRKQPGTTPSNISADVLSRKYRQRVSTPTSTLIDETPLGTKSQRLFGGSEFFAQIMNELEEQTLY
ncbi:unnamed protein product [Adineta steineri]|uniref:Uncharacterized protein n=1 Tax=Adineta steineri TaxID=433720 RepID=A0A814XR66_9BILA|nr:unnamed protein product [Adineta steineri]CAF3636577.1 unnamed protein product [Adineta steineri]